MYVFHMSRSHIRHLAYSGICLSLCLVLPFLTGQIPQIGSALCPMHLPVLLAGYLCGPWWAASVGAIAPLLRYALFGMPPIFPTGLAMCFELLTYGLISGLLYQRLPKKTVNIYTSLIAAMLSGRIIWGCAQVILLGLSGSAFSWSAFLAGAFANAIPGIVVQIIFLPMLVLSLQKTGAIPAPALKYSYRRDSRVTKRI